MYKNVHHKRKKIGQKLFEYIRTINVSHIEETMCQSKEELKILNM